MIHFNVIHDWWEGGQKLTLKNVLSTVMSLKSTNRWLMQVLHLIGVLFIFNKYMTGVLSQSFSSQAVYLYTTCMMLIIAGYPIILLTRDLLLSRKWIGAADCVQLSLSVCFKAQLILLLKDFNTVRKSLTWACEWYSSIMAYINSQWQRQLFRWVLWTYIPV